MGEFCGIDPNGAGLLRERLSRIRQRVPYMISGVRTDNAKAGPDLAPGAEGAVNTLKSFETFFNHWTKDLDWRIKYITAIDKDGVTEDMLSGELPYRSFSEAERQAKSDADALARAWEEYRRLEDGEARRRLLEQIDKLTGHAGDPAYAKAFLNKLGHRKYVEIFHRYVDPRGYPGPGADMTGLKDQLGPLAQLFATADHNGDLSPEFRKQVLEMAPDALSLFVNLAPQTDAFLTDAAHQIFTKYGKVDSREEVGRALRFIQALHGRGTAVQRLLADEAIAKELLNPNLLADPTSDRLLANALDRALKQGTGDPETLRAAWKNVIKTLGSGNAYQQLFRRPELSKVLARNLGPYAAHLAYLKGLQASPRAFASGEPPHDGPVPPPNGVPLLDPSIATDEVERLLGGALSNPGAAQEFTNAVRSWWQQHHPRYALDPEDLSNGRVAEDPAYQRMVAISGGLANLVIGSHRYANFSYERAKEDVKALLKLPVEVGVIASTNGLPLIGQVAAAKGSGELLGRNAELDRLAEKLTGDPPPGQDEVENLFQNQFDREITRAIDELADRVKAIGASRSPRASGERSRRRRASTTPAWSKTTRRPVPRTQQKPGQEGSARTGDERSGRGAHQGRVTPSGGGKRPPRPAVRNLRQIGGALLRQGLDGTGGHADLDRSGR